MFHWLCLLIKSLFGFIFIFVVVYLFVLNGYFLILPFLILILFLFSFLFSIFIIYGLFVHTLQNRNPSIIDPEESKLFYLDILFKYQVVLSLTFRSPLPLFFSYMFFKETFKFLATPKNHFFSLSA